MSIVANQKIRHTAKRQRLDAGRGFPSLEPNAEKVSHVDRLSNAIYGYKVMSLGEAKGHGNEVDETTLKQIVQLGQELGDKGIKSRFTHPGMSSDGLGNYLGRTKNLRLAGDSVIGDLYLSPRAFDTPNGNLGKYVLDMAESDPDQFGASVVISIDEELRLEKDGTPKKNDAGDPLPPVIRVKKLHASDIVDEPAANEGFFATIDDSIPDFPARQAFALMDRMFGDADAEVITQRIGDFVTRYLHTKGQTMPQVETQPDPAPVVTVAPPEVVLPLSAPSEAPEQIERRRCAEIMSLCSMGGKPELASDFINNGTPVVDVQSHLFRVMCNDRRPVDGGGGGSNPAPVADPDAKFKTEYAADRAYFVKSGTTEADYIASRRVTEGLDPLKKTA